MNHGKMKFSIMCHGKSVGDPLKCMKMSKKPVICTFSRLYNISWKAFIIAVYSIINNHVFFFALVTFLTPKKRPTA